MIMSNQKNAGRKIGAKNSIRTDLRKELTTIFLDNFKKEVRNFAVMDYEKRMRLLIGILPYIIQKGKVNITDEESEIQDLIFEKVKPFYSKIDLYLNTIPSEKKPAILLSLIKTLNITSSAKNAEILLALQSKGRNIKKT